MAFVMASIADDWSRFFIGFKTLPLARVILARHLELYLYTLMLKVLYFITRLVAFAPRRGRKVGKALHAVFRFTSASIRRNRPALGRVNRFAESDPSHDGHPTPLVPKCIMRSAVRGRMMAIHIRENEPSRRR
jgi:hypothetical protein